MHVSRDDVIKRLGKLYIKTREKEISWENNEKDRLEEYKFRMWYRFQKEQIVLTVLFEWIREQRNYVIVNRLNRGKVFLKCTKDQSPELTRMVTAKVTALSKSAKQTS